MEAYCFSVLFAFNVSNLNKIFLALDTMSSSSEFEMTYLHALVIRLSLVVFLPISSSESKYDGYNVNISEKTASYARFTESL